MIAAYHGKPIVPRPRSSPSTPLRLGRKPLRGFGGCDPLGSAAQETAMPFKANPIGFDNGG